MINYYDDFLESHIAQLIDMQMKEVSWKYDYDSKPNGTQKHWHVFCGHNMDECNQNGYEFIVPIWEKIKNVVDVELERVYLNAHTFGIEPHIHTDAEAFAHACNRTQERTNARVYVPACAHDNVDAHAIWWLSLWKRCTCRSVV